MHSKIWMTFLLTAAAVWLLSFPIIRWLRSRQVLDRPNERSSHAVPTPRGGGLAITCVLIPAFVGLYSVTRETFAVLLAVCAAMLAAISFLDDLRPLRASIRFSIHLAAAMVLVMGLALWQKQPANETGIGALKVFVGVFLCVYLVGYTNAFNFMDGINGISGAQAFISGAGVALLASLAGPEALDPVALAGAFIAGAAAGFLPHNFPRAKVFMGDVGSVPIGFVTAGLGVVLAFKAGLWLLVPAVLLHANYILDTSITLLRRVLRGEKWYLPHREHFYQRLIRSGKSHTAVTTWEASLQLVTLGITVAYLYAGATVQACLAIAVILMWLAFFGWAEVRFRSSQSGAAKLPSNLARGATS